MGRSLTDADASVCSACFGNGTVLGLTLRHGTGNGLRLGDRISDALGLRLIDALGMILTDRLTFGNVVRLRFGTADGLPDRYAV